MFPLEAIRTEKGLTIEQAAEQVGYHPVYLRDLESGRRPLSDKALVRFSRGYGIPFDELERRIAEAARTRPVAGVASRRAAANGT